MHTYEYMRTGSELVCIAKPLPSNIWMYVRTCVHAFAYEQGGACASCQASPIQHMDVRTYNHLLTGSELVRLGKYHSDMSFIASWHGVEGSPSVKGSPMARPKGKTSACGGVPPAASSRPPPPTAPGGLPPGGAHPGQEPPPPTVPGGLTPQNCSKRELDRVVEELQHRRQVVEARSFH